jgi:phosphatidylserine/phosphatidylglycerophosphate/cardiolipin synthase-like enzyme
MAMRTSPTHLIALLALTMALGCEGGAGDGSGSGDGKADGWTTVSGGQRVYMAPDWMLSTDGSGTWEEEAPEGSTFQVIRAWVDARVANLRYDKRVFVEVLSPYDNGTFMRVLLPASFRAGIGSDRERWGTDAIELYPDGGPGGSALAGPVMFRLRMQHDADGDGTDEMVLTRWQTLYGGGEPVLPTDDPWLPGLTSPVRTAEPDDLPDLYFSPFDDPGRRVVEEIDAIIAAQREHPEERHTLHAAVFNIIDPEIVDHLIEAHRAGVEVRLLFDGRKFRPWYTWYDGDDRLLAAGVPLLGVVREDTGAMHDKIALFDGRVVATGSANWEWGARFENHENMLVTSDVELVRAYAGRFEALAGGVQRERDVARDPNARVSVSFAPDEAPYRIAGQLVDQARETVYLAMFTAKDVEYEQDGQRTSLLGRLIAARRRGVEVIVVVDQGIHEASEYHGVLSEDDQHDEWLENEGIHVVRADNTFGTYASMHHKFMVIDGEVLVTGAFNWYYDAAYRNDEDQLVWRDGRVAARYTGELVDLLRRYDPDFEAGAWPRVDVSFAVHHDGTAWGDQVVLVGDLPEAGAWDPAAGIELDGSSWPVWRGALSLPIGVRLFYKLVTRHRSGAVSWEWGDNRLFTTPVDVTETVVDITYRR